MCQEIWMDFTQFVYSKIMKKLCLNKSSQLCLWKYLMKGISQSSLLDDQDHRKCLFGEIPFELAWHNFIHQNDGMDSYHGLDLSLFFQAPCCTCSPYECLKMIWHPVIQIIVQFNAHQVRSTTFCYCLHLFLNQTFF